MGLDERPGNPFQHLGVGHGRCLLAVTVFPQLPPPPTSSAWTTTSDTACCGSPATSSGGSVTCRSLCETCCWPSCSSGGSHCYSGPNPPAQRSSSWPAWESSPTASTVSPWPDTPKCK